MKKFGILFFGIVLPSITLGSGLDLTLLYGTRYIGLGGTHISIATDAYAPFYNPAGMIGVENMAVALNSSNLLTQRNAPITGPNGQMESEWNYGPLFYAGTVYRLMDRVAIGVGVFPTALQGAKYTPVDYGTGTLANREFSNLMVRVEIAPSVAFKATEHLALGLSYRAGYTKYAANVGQRGLAMNQDVSGWDASGLKVGTLLSDVGGFSAALTYRFENKVNMTGDTAVDVGVAQMTLPTTHDVTIPAQLQAGVSYEWIPGKCMTAFTYEFTQNSAIGNDISNVQGLAAIAGSDQVVLPLQYEDGHAFHLGTEYVFDLSNDTRLRTDVGLALDLASTRTGKPHPLIPPAAAYLGYAGAVQYETGNHVYGLSMNYGEYEHTTATLDADAVSYPGTYGLKAILASVDYQYRF